MAIFLQTRDNCQMASFAIKISKALLTGETKAKGQGDANLFILTMLSLHISGENDAMT
jgi:hypothetical protein